MTHPAFEAVAHHAIPALDIEVQDCRHRATGARHLHLAAPRDGHNVFLVAFLTVPQDSTGVAHILEHTALCGSRRYPVRDPFFMMTRRSLSTFMNAFTASDWTAYPFATQNRRDFDNLLEVYLDAAFFPLLDELDFCQEGHRVEFADPADPASPLVYKGVVYNEMKGAMSAPVSALAQHLQSALFPTTTYHHNSGGDPAVIPELSHDQLRAFHARHYHPSNAVFITYGDIPAEHHQGRFHELALARFQAAPPAPAVGDEQRYTAPRQVRAHYALEGVEDTRDRTHVVLAWLLGRNDDPLGVMRSRLLSDVLLDNSSSPLRRALETCGLGSAPSALCGFDDSTREASFSCGLEGSNPEQAGAVEALVMEVLEDVAQNGVDRERLESVLHQLELGQREITGDGFPYGLKLMLESLPPVLHGGDPAAALDIDPQLETLRRDIEDPGFIRSLARTLLVDNPHRVCLVMEPDPGLGPRQREEEARRLEALARRMGPAERERVVERARALEARQAREDDPDVLPRIGLRDIPPERHIPQGRPDPVAGLPCTWYAQGTNGMVYQQLVVDLPELDPETLDLLPLYCLCLTEVGSAGRDYLQTQALQAAVTGGVSARCIVRSATDDLQQARGIVVLAGKGLQRNHHALAALLRETFESPRFDEHSRIRELVAQVRAQRDDELTDHGHVLAMTAAAAGLTPVAALSHRWEGLAGLRALRTLDDALDDPAALESLAGRLATVQERLLGSRCQLLVVHERDEAQALAASLETTWQAMPGRHPGEALALPAPAAAAVQGWSASTQVSFCARVYPTVPPDHPDAAALTVLGDYLRNGFLHRAVREQGGAYGAGATYHGDTGSFRFYSYRDPRLGETLADFDRSVAWALEDRQRPERLEEAVLGVVAAIDRPGSPAGEAIGTFIGGLFGRTPAQRQAFRARVLAVSEEDLRRVAETYLRPEQARTAVLASAEALAGHGGPDLVVESI